MGREESNFFSIVFCDSLDKEEDDDEEEEGEEERESSSSSSATSRVLLGLVVAI